MIHTLLVANRGEIACRIFRTCSDLGIRTVAVYSDADEHALHTRRADTAVRLPGAAPADTYLRGDLIVKAALAAGADAVHPGYGFLSENPDFARAVLDAGLSWIGPSPEAIEAMASKTRAKRLMGLEPLGQVIQGDLPVLVKAAAGGGGRGDADRAPSGRAPGRPGRGARRGRERLRGRRGVHGAVHRERPPHRGADPRRHPRHRVAARHPRLLPPAPPPEGDRGGPGTRPARAARTGAADPGGTGRARRLLRRRGHRRVPGRRGPRALPGDEHPPPGRTPGDRGGVRARPRRRAAPDRRGPCPGEGPAEPARPRDRGPPVRRGSRPRLGPADRHPAPARRAARGPPRHRLRRPATPSASTTTRCSRRPSPTP